MKDEKLKSFLVGCLAFFALFYPLIHNSFLYGLNYFADLIGITIGKKNIFLLGWKDALFLFLFPALLLFKNRFIAILFSIILAVFLYGRHILLIKEFIFPFLATLTLAFYEKELTNLAQQNRRKIYLVVCSLALALLLFSYLEYSFRVNKHITNSNFFNYNHMRLINEIRCSKYFSVSSASHDYETCIEKSMLNSYKLKHDQGEYTAIQALFLPVGDSVILSFLLIYLLILFLIFRDHDAPFSKFELIFLILLTSSVFLTLNRVNSLLTVLIICSIFGFGYKLFDSRAKKAAFLLIPAFVFLYRADYLFLSIFDHLTPSNLGHAVIFKDHAQDQISSDEPLEADISPVPPIFKSDSFIQKKWPPPNIDEYGVNISRESNVLKIINIFGLLGFLLIIGIWIILIRKIYLMCVHFKKAGNFKVVITISTLLCFSNFLYQFISPYIVSGYVIFFPFVSIIFLSSGFSQSRYEH